MNLPGSQQMAHGKRFFEALPWVELQAFPDTAVWAEAPVAEAPLGDWIWYRDNPLFAPQACGLGDRLRAIYVLVPRPIMVRSLRPNAAYRVTLFDPVSGERTPAAPVRADGAGEVHFAPPAHAL